MEDLACAQELPGVLGGVGAHERQVPVWRTRNHADGVRGVSSVEGAGVGCDVYVLLYTLKCPKRE